MLAERLLTDILKLDWADVHDEAHKMEHAISPLIEKQILTLLDNPETCPHGNPIPGLQRRPACRRRRCASVAEGETVMINNIAEHAEDDADLMHYLQRNVLTPGARLHIDEVARRQRHDHGVPMDDSRQVVVGLPTAELILVRALKTDGRRLRLPDRTPVLRGDHEPSRPSRRAPAPERAYGQRRAPHRSEEADRRRRRALSPRRAADASSTSTSTARGPTSTCRSTRTAPTSSAASGRRIADIPYGETLSYAEVAMLAGAPGAVPRRGLRLRRTTRSRCGALPPRRRLRRRYRRLRRRAGHEGLAAAATKARWRRRGRGSLQPPLLPV